MSTEIPEFQRYQQAFTARLRDPQHQPLPAGVSRDRMAVYEEIVFNNLFESVSSCFPIARSMLGESAWLNLVQAFMREYAANSPLFRSIPEQFLHYLNLPENNLTVELPPYFSRLCHYEWVELHIASFAADSTGTEITESENTSDIDLANERPRFTPAMLLLEYDYAIHKISPNYQPEQQSTQLLVYRNRDDHVQFMELNAVTYRLISLLQNEGLTGKQALTLIAKELQHPQPKSIMEFGLSLLSDLKHKGVIIGTQT